MKISFGKYSGQDVEDIWEKDKDYIYWLSENCRNMNDQLLLARIDELIYLGV